MKPINFKEVNVTYAEDHPEYNPLPVFRDANGAVVSCWKLSWKERLQILWRGKFFLTVHTFNKPLQPLLPEIDNPIGN